MFQQLRRNKYKQNKWNRSPSIRILFFSRYLRTAQSYTSMVSMYKNENKQIKVETNNFECTVRRLISVRKMFVTCLPSAITWNFVTIVETGVNCFHSDLVPPALANSECSITCPLSNKSKGLNFKHIHMHTCMESCISSRILQFITESQASVHS